MKQDTHVKLNPGLSWHTKHLAGGKSLRQQIELQFNKETCEALHLEHSTVWC
jgi:hypothetical protein